MMRLWLAFAFLNAGGRIATPQPAKRTSWTMLTLRPPRLARLATVLFAPHAQRPTLGHLQVRQQQARQCSTKFAEISIDRSALHNDDQSASASGPSVPREPETPLATELKTLIGMRGPITVAEYMTQALGHPQHGYYMRKVGGGDRHHSYVIDDVTTTLTCASSMYVYDRTCSARTATLPHHLRSARCSASWSASGRLYAGCCAQGHR
jgi:hypothetical protein